MTTITLDLNAATNAIKLNIQAHALALAMPKDHPMLLKLDSRKLSYLRRLERRIMQQVANLSKAN